MSDNDVWIEVNEAKTELVRFYSAFAECRSIYGTPGAHHAVYKFNLTAYVRHMIDAALEEKK